MTCLIYTMYIQARHFRWKLKYIIRKLTAVRGTWKLIWKQTITPSAILHSTQPYRALLYIIGYAQYVITVSLAETIASLWLIFISMMSLSLQSTNAFLDAPGFAYSHKYSAQLQVLVYDTMWQSPVHTMNYAHPDIYNKYLQKHAVKAILLRASVWICEERLQLI